MSSHERALCVHCTQDISYREWNEKGHKYGHCLKMKNVEEGLHELRVISQQMMMDAHGL